jgi:hypothetical protein
MMDTTTQPTTDKPRRKGRPKGTERFQLQQSVAKVINNNPGITARELAQTADIAPSTATKYLAKWGINKQELDVFVENRNAIVKDKQRQILDAITSDKLEKATAKDLTVCYGIMLDKDRLESGESTSNIASWTTVISKVQHTEVDITPS